MLNSDIYVLGVTGPFGSGCTTFAKFFHPPEDEIDSKKCRNIINYLSWYQYFDEPKGEINFEDKIDKEIYKRYKLIDKIEGDLIKENNAKITNDEREIIKAHLLRDPNKPKGFTEIYQNVKEIDSVIYNDVLIQFEIKRKLLKELKLLLEEREALNSLSGSTSMLKRLINPCNKKQHRFQLISLSDIIVFKNIHMFDEFEDSYIEEALLIPKDKIEKKINDVKKYRDIIRGVREKIVERLKSDFKIINGDVIDSFYNEYFLKATTLDKVPFQKLLAVVNECIIPLVHEVKKKLGENMGLSYRILMQDFGDNLRRCGNPYNYIKTYENSNKGQIETELDTRYILVREAMNFVNILSDSKRSNDKRKFFFIVDAIRNPYEILFLRERFINFYMISLFAEKNIRLDRRDKQFHKDKTSFDENDERDSGSKNTSLEAIFKQSVTACNKLADMSINNHVFGDSRVDLVEKNEEYSLNILQLKIIRCFALIIDKGCTKPRVDEMLMNQAYAMAMKSNCLSRQVGAVVVDKDNYIVGGGWNDVGEGHVSCGLIECKDLKEDRFKKYFTDVLGIKELNIPEFLDTLGEKYDKNHCICFKELISLANFGKKKKKLFSDKLMDELHKNLSLEQYDKVSSGIDELAKLSQKKHENCQALHAEENAIIQCTRRGGMGLHDGKIYTTTYPCPLCAKKIMQVGIQEVIYDDPYPSPLSEIILKDGNRKVFLRHFEGIKPLGFFKLFKPDHDQKEWQELEKKNLIRSFSFTEESF